MMNPARWWEGPLPTVLFGTQLHIGKTLQLVHYDRLHSPVLVCVVDQVLGEECVSHVSRQTACLACSGQRFEHLDPMLNEVCHGTPTSKPLIGIAEDEVCGGEGFRNAPVVIDVLPRQVHDTRMNVDGACRHLDQLWCARGALLCDQR
jgi:hypothetical protein